MTANQPKRIPALSAPRNKTLLWSVAFFLLVVVVDQATKLWAIDLLSDQPTREVLGRFLMLTLVYNEGGAMGTNFGSSTYYLVTSILILAFVMYYIYANRRSRHIAYPLSFIAGGAIGNIIDRLRLGRVVDFVDVDFIDIDLLGFHLERWWTFNLADAAISCSIVFLLIHVLFFRHPSPSPEAAAPED